MIKPKKIPNVKIEKMGVLAFQNCLRLHKDSIALFNSGSYSSAFYLSVIALEEFGKVYWIDGCIFQTRVMGKELGRDFQTFWLTAIYKHSHKQGIFAHNQKYELPAPILKSIDSRKIEIEKQNSLYVGLPRKGKHIDWNGKVINPLKANRKRTLEQITALNDCLLITILSNIKVVGGFDNEMLEPLLDREMFYRLRFNWDYMGRKTRGVLNKIEMAGDDWDYS